MAEHNNQGVKYTHSWPVIVTTSCFQRGICPASPPTLSGRWTLTGVISAVLLSWRAIIERGSSHSSLHPPMVLILEALTLELWTWKSRMIHFCWNGLTRQGGGNELWPEFQQQPMASSSSTAASPLSYRVSCVFVCVRVSVDVEWFITRVFESGRKKVQTKIAAHIPHFITAWWIAVFFLGGTYQNYRLITKDLHGL